MKKITTVTGDIRPEELGFTLSHEHVIQTLITMKPMFQSIAPKMPEEKLKLKDENIEFLREGGWMVSDDVLRVDDDYYLDFIIQELKEYKKAGGDSLCEASVHGLQGRPVTDLRKISEESGVKIVFGTGMYVGSSWPERFQGKDEEALKKMLEEEVENGVCGTDVKPGYMKSAFSPVIDASGFLEEELMAYRVGCRIAAETGMGMMVHQSQNEEELLELTRIAIKEIGLPPEKLLFCHVDYNGIHKQEEKIDLDFYKRILDTGIKLSFDGFGMYQGKYQTMNVDDEGRAEAVHQLLKAGYGSQLMMGHDFGIRTNGTIYGGYGYTRVSTYACPRLRELGHTEQEIHQIMVENPKDFLAY